MVTKFPAQIDDQISLPPVDKITGFKANLFNDLRATILSIENTLGINPGLTYNTVRARLDALELGISTLSGGGVSLAQDLGNTVISPKVIGLQGRPMTSVQPNVGQVYIWNGTAWAPGDVSGGTTFAITSFGTTNPIVLIGSIVITPSFTAVYNSTPTSVTLVDSIPNASNSVSSPFTSFTSPDMYSSSVLNYSVSFTLTAQKSPQTPVTRAIRIQWTVDVFWNAAIVPGSYDATFINSLTNINLQTTRAQNITINISGSTIFFFYALPDAYGDPEFIISPSGTTGVLPGGMTKVASGISVNINGIPINYSVWKSDYSNLGNSHVVIS